MDMRASPDPSDIRKLFTNEDPDEVWAKASIIIHEMAPEHDLPTVQGAYDDVIRMFHGSYPGYHPIQTPYHDLGHTLNVFLCAVRLLHGIHISGTPLSEQEMTLIMLAALMHDIGYAMTLDDQTGTGAQYTRIHVDRGVQFMRDYITGRQLPETWLQPLEYMIRSTDHMRDFAQIPFPDARTRLLGQIVGTADLVGQMADQTYLEKLLYLYLEFKEASLGNYKDTHDLLRKTSQFNEVIRHKLDDELESRYAKLTFHFKKSLGIERNFYLESMERNIAYLEQALGMENAEASLAMLRRCNIVDRARSIATLEDSASIKAGQQP